MTMQIEGRPASPGGYGFGDRRDEPRQRVLKGAELRFNGGYGSGEGVIRSLSPHGARMSLTNATGVPAKFELRISTERRYRPVTVCWRRGDLVGVRYDD